jgi:peptidoglycan-N-acetylglucosamine deacetylase
VIRRIWPDRATLAAAGVVALLLVGVRALASARTLQLFGELVARVDATERVVALTFDDGPNAEKVDEIVGVLASRGVRATFFVTGEELEKAPQAGQRLVAAGHQLANHTYSHQHMVFKSPTFIREEIARTDDLIRQAGHEGPIYVRPPFGYKLVGLPWFLMRTGRVTVTWDVEPDSYPAISASPERIATHVVERVRPGSIVLLHVWYGSRRTSLAAVPTVIDRLSENGYRFVTLDELLLIQPLRGRSVLLSARF